MTNDDGSFGHWVFVIDSVFGFRHSRFHAGSRRPITGSASRVKPPLHSCRSSDIRSERSAPSPDPIPTASLEQSLDQRLADLQTQLDKLRAQLMESQRQATIGTIAAVIAHEFNNLLTSIVSYCQYALQSADGDNPD